MLALPAMAQEPITPQTTMREIRQNPAVQASGLYTDIHTWERDLAWFKNAHNNETLEEVVGSGSAASCAAGLNLLIQNYESGTQSCIISRRIPPTPGMPWCSRATRSTTAAS